MSKTWRASIEETGTFIINHLMTKHHAFGPNSVVVFNVEGVLLDEQSSLRVDSLVIAMQHAKLYGLEVMLITTRVKASDDDVYSLFGQLTHKAIPIPEFVYFRHPNSQDMAVFKQKVHAHIHQRGFKVIMTVGCDKSDENVQTELVVKVPKKGLLGQIEIDDYYT